MSTTDAHSRRPHVLLAVSGSVATVKLAELSKRITAFADVRVVTTASAQHFFCSTSLAGAAERVYTDKDEWSTFSHLGDPVLHIELRKWADILVIAPLSANTLAKLANGLCDNLLTSICRAWDLEAPFLIAPAMNTLMWQHPFTQQHLQRVASVYRAEVIPVVAKTLACGDVGLGAMASVDTITAAVHRRLGL